MKGDTLAGLGLVFGVGFPALQAGLLHGGPTARGRSADEWIVGVMDGWTRRRFAMAWQVGGWVGREGIEM